MDPKQSSELLSVAHRLADAAKVETLAHFRTSALKVENKLVEAFDPVTLADRAAEKAMRAILDELRPADGVLGEEFGPKQSKSGLTWVLDPIDGTRGYIAGTPTWGTLIGLHDGDKVIMGVVDQPYIGERFIGGLGTALFSGPSGTGKLGVSSVRSLDQAKIFTTFPEVGTEAERVAFHKVAGACQLTRYGMDCYAYALLAVGQVDLVIEAGLNPYDIQGPIGVIEAAGGIVTNWSGGPADQGGQVLAAATPELHKAALSILASRV